MSKPALRRKRHALLALLGISLLVNQASAVDIFVTSNADSGAGSLREAITNASSGDRIVFNTPGSSTIQLLSDLPVIPGDVSFDVATGTTVAIDRNGNGPLTFTGSLVDPTQLNINTGGVASLDADIDMSSTTRVFGNGDVTGNMTTAGTLAPGATSTAGSLGTLNVTGNLDASNASVQVDISDIGATTESDLIDVTGTATITDAELVPNFIGSQYKVGDSFVVLESGSPVVGAFTNESDVYALPNRPFLEAAMSASGTRDQFSFIVQDNNDSFTTVVSGSNQTSAAGLLDDLRGGSPPAAVTTLRDGSADQVVTAVDQLSGSIYPSLIGAEINHIQNNLESIRDRVVMQTDLDRRQCQITPWVRAYGITSEVDQDDLQTVGYRHQVGGLELGGGVASPNGLALHSFAHLASGDLETRGVDQHANIDSYRMGGSVEYLAEHVYLVAAGGAGTQDYEVRRSLSALEGSDFAESRFDGSSQFGYFEIGTLFSHAATLWSPYLALHTTRVELDAITETGDADFALINDGGSGESLRSVLGLSLNQSAPTPLGIATTRLRFGWMHEYLDESETFLSQVANGGTPTGSLEDRGVMAGDDWAILRAQVDMGVLLGGQFTVAYLGQANSDSSFNSLLAGTRWIF
ncbi:serine protease [Rhodopirellula maiorica SM1]|uniref:Serine protease n=1 Tax=Rhodopirellula maiorica SM1 TaxID=1265738 RepID=M5RGH7_9BACT|nr:autotransporter outer membrane beta-barrel domain-containing protein [Rhodopirellula maiorica]EMI18430.1 serine protease [Rhodopirellula maiorica SM1]